MTDRGDEDPKDVEFSVDGLGDESFVLRFRASKLKVRELVTRAVEEFVRKQIAGGVVVAQKPRRRTFAPMTPKEIDAQSKRGAVGARSGPREVDPAKEVAKALRALRERRIRVFVDGREAGSADDEIVLAPWTKVVFIRALRRGGFWMPGH